MWMRWNDSTHIFEQSFNDGASWAVLPLNASVINEGSFSTGQLPATVAYKNIDNAFTTAQTLPSVSLISGPNSILQFRDTSSAVDARLWRLINYADGQLRLDAVNDASSVVQGQPIVFSRAGDVTIGRNFLVTNLFTSTGYGAHRFSASGASGQQLSVRNTGNANTAYAELAVGNDTDPRLALVQATSSTFLPTLYVYPAAMLLYTQGTGGMSIVTVGATPIRVYTNSVERLRITELGVLLVGAQTFPPGNPAVAIVSDGSVRLPLGIMNTYTGATGNLISFFNYGNGLCGSISEVNTSAVAYNTSSDQRLKDDKGRVSDLSALRKLVVHDFIWKDIDVEDRGIFAQEAYDLYPRAITPGDDELTETGHLKQPWMTDYSKFVPDIIAGWQEHDEKITTLRVEIELLKDALKGGANA